MTLSRVKLTYATLVVSESAWLFAFISILGVAAGSTGSPLSFFAILGLLGLSTLTYSYIRDKEFQAFELFYFGATFWESLSRTWSSPRHTNPTKPSRLTG